METLFREVSAPITDKHLEALGECVLAEPVEEHIGIVLALHKRLLQATSGHAHDLARLELLALTTLVDRVAPGTVDDVFGEWEWDAIVERLEDA